MPLNLRAVALALVSRPGLLCVYVLALACVSALTAEHARITRSPCGRDAGRLAWRALAWSPRASATAVILAHQVAIHEHGKDEALGSCTMSSKPAQESLPAEVPRVVSRSKLAQESLPAEIPRVVSRSKLAQESLPAETLAALLTRTRR